MLKLMKDCTFCDDRSQLKKLPLYNRDKKKLESHEKETEKLNEPATEQLKIDDVDLNEKKSDEKIEIKKEEQISANSNSEVIQIDPSEVHVIDELKVVGKSLTSQLEKLEWWQNLDAKIDKDELMRPLQALKGEIKPKNKEMTNRALLDPKFDLQTLEFFSDSQLERLKVVGDIQGFCTAMKMHAVKPDIRIFMQLLEVIEGLRKNVYFKKLFNFRFRKISLRMKWTS